MKRLGYVAALLLIFFAAGARAAFEPKEIGPRAIGFSGAYSAAATDAYAPFWNPGALGRIKAREAASFYSRAFALGDLAQTGIAYADKTRFGNMAFGFTQFGSKTYLEQEMIYTHAYQITPRLSAGYNLKMLLLRIENFGSSVKFAMDLGLEGKVSERLDLSLSGKNINRPAFGSQKEEISSIWTSGFVFKVMPGLLFACDVEGLGTPSARLKSGMEVDLSPAFALRGGLQSGPSRFSGGFRARHGNLSLDYAYQHHPFLPGSHHMGLSYSWGDPESFAGFLNIKAEKKPAKKSAAKIYKFNEKMNLMTASKEELLQIPGIGEFTAEKLIAYRDQVGLKTIDDVLYIPGMTKRIFLLIKDTCSVEKP